MKSIDFRGAKFSWSKWQILYWASMSFLLTVLSGASSSLAGSAFLISVRTGENVSESITWGILVLAPSLLFVFLFSMKGFQQGLLIGSIVLAPSCFSMVFGRFLPDVFGLVGFSFFDSLQALILTTIGLTSIAFAFIAAAFVFGLSYSLLIISLAIAGFTAFLTQDQGILDSWFGAIISICISFTGYYVANHALSEHTNFLWLKSTALTFLNFGRKSFRSSDLTDADFTQATLENVDLREANLLRTCWFKAKGLERARLGNTYLENPKIRQLVITCDGQGQKFDGLDLTGVNLQDANLQDSSFVGANLNQSNLRGADLSRAVLKQTQLDEADLSGAILTGACIEDWGITGTTKLKNVQCDYVFMRVETPDNPNRLRKPDNWRETFAEGEFADFIQPFFNTLDLYHSQDVDPRAISIALKKLADDHPDDDLQFVAIERRGNNGINLRFTTAPNANKSDLSHEYFANYTQIKKELPVSVQIRLAEQDAEIRTLKGTIEQFIQTGTHQSTIHAENIQVIQGEIVVTENRGINIQAGDNANISGLSSGDGVVNLGTISGNVTNAINQLPESPEPDQPSLKALLTQLQQAIEADTDLSDPDKSDLLEQVQALAEAKQTEEPAKREGLVRKAIKMFDATLNSLPDTARIVDACSKLLPVILKTLGLPI